MKSAKIFKINLFEFFSVALIFLIAVFLFHETKIDEILIRPFYSSESASWPFQNAFLFQNVLHKGGEKLDVLIVISFISILFTKKIRSDRGLQILFYHGLLSALLCMAIVTVLKSSNPILCPWDTGAFGGLHGFVSLFSFFDRNLPVSHCFPAGHSSGGFAWISFYFSGQLVYGERRARYLAPGLILGCIFGITQQMRGAHFISHDFATFVICWIVSGLTAIGFEYLFKKKTPKMDSQVL